jgi:hypothetical protein
VKEQKYSFLNLLLSSLSTCNSLLGSMTQHWELVNGAGLQWHTHWARYSPVGFSRPDALKTSNWPCQSSTTHYLPLTLTTHPIAHAVDTYLLNLLLSLHDLLLLPPRVSCIDTYTICTNTIPTASHLHPSHPKFAHTNTSHPTILIPTIVVRRHNQIGLSTTRVMAAGQCG